MLLLVSEIREKISVERKGDILIKLGVFLELEKKPQRIDSEKMTKHICAICGAEIEGYGAVSFSEDEEGNSKEIHLCDDCSNEVSGF